MGREEEVARKTHHLGAVSQELVSGRVLAYATFLAGLQDRRVATTTLQKGRVQHQRTSCYKQPGMVGRSPKLTVHGVCAYKYGFTEHYRVGFDLFSLVSKIHPPFSELSIIFCRRLPHLSLC